MGSEYCLKVLFLNNQYVFKFNINFHSFLPHHYFCAPLLLPQFVLETRLGFRWFGFIWFALVWFNSDPFQTEGMWLSSLGHSSLSYFFKIYLLSPISIVAFWNLYWMNAETLHQSLISLLYIFVSLGTLFWKNSLTIPMCSAALQLTP